MSLMRCACGVDVHAHVVPEAFPAYLAARGPRPGRPPSPRLTRAACATAM